MDIEKLVGNVDKKKEGVWLNYPPDMEFRLAFLQNKDYQHYVSDRMMRARKGKRNFPVGKSEEIITEALVKFIVKGWKGVTTSGAPYEFNAANVAWLLNEYPDFRNWVIEEASDIENFGGKSAEPSDEEDGPEGELKSGPEVAAPVGT